MDERRSKPSYTDIVANSESPQIAIPKIAAVVPKRSKGKSTSARLQRDPFHVKNCLLDVGHEIEESDRTAAPPKPLLAADQDKKVSVRKRLKRSSTSGSNSRMASKDYQSLLPGNCTSYYSIRKYYEQEKDKLLHRWSPEEQRKQTVRWILDNLKLPPYSTMRHTTTSAIFRDFSKTRSISEPHGQQPDSSQTALPVIQKRVQGGRNKTMSPESDSDLKRGG